MSYSAEKKILNLLEPFVAPMTIDGPAGFRAVDPSPPILEYYSELDRGDISAVMRRFDERAVYRRGNRPPYEGISRIEQFFRTDRKLQGTHFISAVSQHPDVDMTVVIVKGVFKAESVSFETQFKDVWILNERGKAEYRRSWISRDS